MTTDILYEQRGKVGLVTLNRVKALNALSHDMVKSLAAQLEAWRDDDSIAAVILQSASEKAFSAGGDIRVLYEGKGNPPYDFFWDEYRLNQMIHRYEKPYISLINGIVMGGGVGISMHGRFVIAGEKTTFAMPEVGIGFFPDVGGSYLLPRMKGHSGTYCALSGTRLKQGDCLALGLATHAISSEKYDEVIERIAGGEAAQVVLDSVAEGAEPRLDAETLAVVDECFAGDSVAAILANLRASDAPQAEKMLGEIINKSPTSVYVSFGQMVRGKDLSFEECMKMEYRIVHRILEEEDFYEGVRATIVDKDGAPKWNPADFDQVDMAHIDNHFAPLEDKEELHFNG